MIARRPVVRPAMASGLATAPAFAGPLLQRRRRGHAMAVDPRAQRAALTTSAAAAASLRPLGLPSRLRQGSSSQLPRRTRSSQHVTVALGAFGSGSAGGRAPPRRRFIPPALMTRLSMTLLLVWLARLGHFIPVPGDQLMYACSARAVASACDEMRAYSPVAAAAATLLSGFNLCPLRRWLTKQTKPAGFGLAQAGGTTSAVQMLMGRTEVVANVFVLR